MIDMKTGKTLMTFEGHKSFLHDVKVLDPTKIITCSEDQTIKIWEIETGECSKTYSIGNAVFSIEIFSIEKIAFTSEESEITIMSKSELKKLNGHHDELEVWSIKKLSNDHIIAGSVDVCLLDINSNKCLKRFVGHKSYIFCLEILSNDTILSGSEDKTIKVWNINTGDCLQTLTGHTGSVLCINVLSSQRIISGSSDSSIKLWCLKSNSCIKTINVHSDDVTSIQVISENKVVTSSIDKTVKILDVDLGECIQTFQQEKEIKTIVLL